MNIRRGVSLTELLVVMGTSTVALLAATGMLRQAMTQHRHAENEVSVHRVAERLTSQFRQDVHAAESVAWSDAANESELRLQVPATTQDDVATEVVYTILGDELIRLARPLTPANVNEPNGSLHRESYRFPNDYRIELNRLDAPARLQLTVGQFRRPAAVRTLDNGNSPGRDMAELQAIVNIQAVLGKYHRSRDALSRGQGDAL